MADTCGPGPFSLGNPETTRGILEAAGFDGIELHQRDFDYFMGADMDEAIDSLLAIGPGAELIRLNGEYGESRRGEIAEALRDHYTAWQKPDGSRVVRRFRLDRRGHEPRLARGARSRRRRAFVPTVVLYRSVGRLSRDARLHREAHSGRSCGPCSGAYVHR